MSCKRRPASRSVSISLVLPKLDNKMPVIGEIYQASASTVSALNTFVGLFVLYNMFMLNPNMPRTLHYTSFAPSFSFLSDSPIYTQDLTWAANDGNFLKSYLDSRGVSARHAAALSGSSTLFVGGAHSTWACIDAYISANTGIRRRGLFSLSFFLSFSLSLSRSFLAPASFLCLVSDFLFDIFRVTLLLCHIR
ncbi:hypothetical protein M432DRAFT_669637 [Thermoascus aurantiacus ATCC 26904]